ncbi:MAG TPA: glycosyltransferase family A protein [Marinagarivorans sp.]|nr:glycosyltransferase family A protein [Marinagarivorans sp.]
MFLNNDSGYVDGKAVMSLRVSVIIPAYNSARTIERALRSVVEQTLQPHEIILVDDGSSDDTVALVRRTFPSVIIIAQANAGASAARNRGVAEATGELIAFLDSDDAWHLQKLQMQVGVFERSPQLNFLSTQCEYFTEQKWLAEQPLKLAHFDRVDIKELDFYQVFAHPFLATPSVMMRKAFFDSLAGFYQALETAEDVDLWLRAAYHGRYALVSAPLTIVIAQEESLSTRTLHSPYGQHLVVLERFCRGKQFSWTFWCWILPKTKSDIYCKWGSTLLVIQRPVEAWYKLTRSLLCMPTARGFFLWLKALLQILAPKT